MSRSNIVRNSIIFALKSANITKTLIGRIEKLCTERRNI